MKTKRNLAMVDLTDHVDMLGNAMPKPSYYHMKKAKDTVGEPKPVVEIHMPEIHVNDETAGPITMRVASTKEPNLGVQVELTPCNLHYIRLAMNADHHNQPTIGTRRKSEVFAPHGTRWVKRRTSSKSSNSMWGFLSVRSTDKRSKFCRCINADSTDDVDQARSKAVLWVNGCDDHDGDDCEDDGNTDVGSDGSCS